MSYLIVVSDLGNQGRTTYPANIVKKPFRRIYENQESYEKKSPKTVTQV